MVPHILEILLIVAIVVLVFGVGKVKNIGAALGRSGKEFKKALDGESEPEEQEHPIDITPEPKGGRADAHDPKPGARPQPVEDAEIVED